MSDPFPANHWIPLLLLAAILAASVLLPPALVDAGPPLCGFSQLIEHPCPGCGLTRSFVAMGHASVGRAFEFHAFGPALFLLACVGILWFGVGLVRGAALPSPMRLRWFRWLSYAFAASWIIWGIVRIAQP